MRIKFQYMASIFAIALFVFLAFGSDDDNSESSNEPTQSEKIQTNNNLTQAQKDSLLIVERQREIENREKQTISAKNLYYTYQQNEISADNNFKDKKFFVEGTVKEIKKDLFDEIYVTLNTGEIIGSVQCYINDANVAANLQKGQLITVYGKCQGLMMNVLMKDCKVVENISDLKSRQ